MEKLANLVYGKYLEDFDLIKAEEIQRGEEMAIRIEFRERTNKVPYKGLTQNGYCRPIEIIDSPIASCATYLVFHRRRWKDPKTGNHLVNQYNLTIKGTKLTQRFGFFLKEKDRDEIDEFLMLFPLLRSTIKEAMEVVQKSSIGIRKPWHKRIFKKS